MHPQAMSVLSWCCASESERTAGLPVTGRRSRERESLPAARRGESDMASAVQKIKLSPSRDIPFNKLERTIRMPTNFPMKSIGVLARLKRRGPPSKPGRRSMIRQTSPAPVYS
jgi:hypothetical protein